MDTLCLVSGYRAVHNETLRFVLRIHVVISRPIGDRCGWRTGAALVHTVCFPTVGGGAHAAGYHVSRVPVHRKIGPRVVRDSGLCDGVL